MSTPFDSNPFVNSPANADFIPDTSLLDNAAERLPLTLLLDCSGSMEGDKIIALNAGLKVLAAELKRNAKLSASCRVSTVTFFGDDEVLFSPFVDAHAWTAPSLTASGRTPTGKAMAVALAKIEDEKIKMNAAGIARRCPNVFLLTDGVATDAVAESQRLAREAESAKRVQIFCIGVGDDANLHELAGFTTNPEHVKQLKGLDFSSLFAWVSRSVDAQLSPGQGVA